jgi:phospholipid transport system substrate-binding protein
MCDAPPARTVASAGRRRLLSAVGAGLLAAHHAGWAQQAPAMDVTAPLRAFYDALLDVMKRAKVLGIKGRYDALAPVVEATFDLPAMTRIAVGPRWTSLPKDVQSALVDAFSRMTIATYASRFDGYASASRSTPTSSRAARAASCTRGSSRRRASRSRSIT